MMIKNILQVSGRRYALVSLVIGAVMISFSSVWVEVSQVTPIASAFLPCLFWWYHLAGARSPVLQKLFLFWTIGSMVRNGSHKRYLPA